MLKAVSADPPALFPIPRQNHLLFSILNVTKKTTEVQFMRRSAEAAKDVGEILTLLDM